MTQNWWIRKVLVLAAAVAALASAVTMAGSVPEPVAGASLGPEWQCSRLVFVFTTCSRVRHTHSATIRAAKIPVCGRLRTA